jgi:hypothetical protein
MSLFIEVESVEKKCKVIINLEQVVEVAPLVQGGCDLFFNDAAAVGGTRVMKVKDSYAQFKQFVLETVSPEDVANKIKKLKAATPQMLDIPKL